MTEEPPQTEPEEKFYDHVLHFYATTFEERKVLREAIETNNFNTETKALVESVTERTKAKLESRGLTLSDYETAYTALKNKDYKVAQEIAKEARKRIEERRSLSSTQTTYDTYAVATEVDPATGKELKMFTNERAAFHVEIVEAEIQKTPEVEAPHVLFLVGLPGGGKSSAREIYQSRYGDAVSTDPDAYRHYLKDNFDGTHDDDINATQKEAFHISDLIYERALQAKRHVIYEGTLRDKEAYLNAIQMAVDHGAICDIVFVQTDFAECFRRSIAYRERGVSLDFLLGSATGLRNFDELLSDPQINRMEMYDNNPHPDEEGSRVFLHKSRDGKIDGKDRLDALLETYRDIL
jgi:predicted kinase